MTPNLQSGPPRTGVPLDVGIVRVSALLGLVPVLRERGIEPAALLAELDLPPDTLDDAEHRIHYRMGGRLLQHAAERCACPHLGLLVGQQADVHSLGPLGRLMMCSATVGAALRCLILHIQLQTRGGVPTHTCDADSATLGYAIYQLDMPGAAQGYDLVMAFEANILRNLCGAAWRPLEVSFSHARPADLAPYRRLFNAPLRFDAVRSEIRFARSWLDQALPGHDIEALRSLHRELATQMMLEPDDCAEQVRRALRSMLPAGLGSEERVAELLALPARSLRRRLALQGTSFRGLVEQVRYEIARQLLLDTAMSTTEIAQCLDYGDASAFTRAFRRWTRQPPAAWRTQARARSVIGRLAI